MRFVDEFRAPELISKAAQEVRRLADPQRHYRLMEVCGGHTHAIYRFGLKDLLPPNIELIHGPGCPVCVLPMGRIDDGLSMTEQPDVIFTAFGDMMRVPASGIRNFSVFCNHVTIIPAIRAILDSPDMRLDAFIGPGHVSTVIGC